MVSRLRLVPRAAALVAAFSVAIAFTFVSGGQPVSAEGFRIQTKIYVGEEEEKEEKVKGKEKVAVSTTTTLFQNGVVYDFLEQPEQTAVFRKATTDKPARFILLNYQEEIQTEVSTEKLSAAMIKLRNYAKQSPDPFLQFCAEPRFEESYDRETGKGTLVNALEAYTVETSQTQRQDALAPYHEFLDWYAQLNALLVTKIPPDPRLKLNAYLARHTAIPSKIELKRAGEDPVRAEHDFTWRLSQEDLQRIDQVHNALTSYKSVDNAEFLRMSQPIDGSK